MLSPSPIADKSNFIDFLHFLTKLFLDIYAQQSIFNQFSTTALNKSVEHYSSISFKKIAFENPFTGNLFILFIVRLLREGTRFSGIANKYFSAENVVNTVQ